MTELSPCVGLTYSELLLNESISSCCEYSQSNRFCSASQLCIFVSRSNGMPSLINVLLRFSVPPSSSSFSHSQTPSFKTTRRRNRICCVQTCSARTDRSIDVGLVRLSCLYLQFQHPIPSHLIPFRPSFFLHQLPESFRRKCSSSGPRYN